jgi:hypothetical protein
MTRQDEIYVSGYDGYAQLDPADSLAGEIGDDPLDAGYSPPDHAPVSLRHEQTYSEMSTVESLERHLAAEEPEVCELDLDLADQDARAGRLVSTGNEFVQNETPYGEDVGRSGWGASAEEAAMHIVEG